MILHLYYIIMSYLNNFLWWNVNVYKLLLIKTYDGQMNNNNNIIMIFPLQILIIHWSWMIFV